MARWICLALARLTLAEVISLDATTELRVCAANVLRITKWPSAAAKAKGRISLVAKTEWPETRFEVHESPEEIKVTTSDVSFTFTRATGANSFGTPSQQVILEDAGHSFIATEDMGKASHQVLQSWRATNPSEALYGGGSYQNGLVNYKGAPLSMIQFNLEAVVPVFVSSSGYGLLWDNYAWSYLNPPKDALVKPIAEKGQSGEVEFQAATDGDYFFHVGRLMDDAKVPSFGAGHETIITAKGVGSTETIIQWTRDQQNHPSSMTGRLPNVKYIINFSFDIPGAGIYVQGPEHGLTTLQSQYAEAIDYYYVYGPSVDAIIGGYREITGAAPLYGKFPYGFWQSREHYGSKAELLKAAQEFRSRGVPLDAIVQDWLYWGKLGWGPEWDPETYPDPADMVKQLDQMHLKLMVSVWGKMDNQTQLFQALKSAGMILGNTNQSHNNWYDAWSVDAQKIYYSICNQSHFSIGVESLWLDATEPEGLVNLSQETHLGSGNLLMNSYSLETTSGIAAGLRRDYPEAQGARVFSLTRSSFAGQQRTGAALWTGDTAGTWDMLRRQVASSINYPLSGIPYWSQDIGGFFRPRDQYDSEEYHQLLIRWFQFGVFTPIFRVHGAGTHTEIWNFGMETMNAINTSAITLRYRLLPYIYSGFWEVETRGYTMQRGLIFDFPEDPQLWNVADEFMFGTALLVTPFVSNASSTSREVYFPKGSWINFHTGTSHAGASHVSVQFQLTEAPCFVRAGAILAALRKAPPPTADAKKAPELAPPVAKKAPPLPPDVAATKAPSMPSMPPETPARKAPPAMLGPDLSAAVVQREVPAPAKKAPPMPPRDTDDAAAGGTEAAQPAPSQTPSKAAPATKHMIFRRDEPSTTTTATVNAPPAPQAQHPSYKAPPVFHREDAEPKAIQLKAPPAQEPPARKAPPGVPGSVQAINAPARQEPLMKAPPASGTTFSAQAPKKAPPVLPRAEEAEILPVPSQPPPGPDELQANRPSPSLEVGSAQESRAPAPEAPAAPAAPRTRWNRTK